MAGPVHRPNARRLRWLGPIVAVVAGMAPFAAVVPPASAGTILGVQASLPSTVTAGQTGVAGTFTITNTSTPPDSASNITLDTITLVPSCGSTAPNLSDCQAAAVDPGVFSISPSATGEAGTACAGTTFTITITDTVEGKVAFTPGGGPVVLQPPGTTGSRCTIDFTFSVLKQPTKDSQPGTSGLQTAQIASATGTSGLGAFGSGTGVSNVTVGAAAPASLSYPVNRQESVDTTQPFTWGSSASAQAYYLIVGTAPGGSNVTNSGALPAVKTSYVLPTAPPSNGQTLWARLYTKINGAYVAAPDVAFTAAPGQATFVNPVQGQTNVDTTQSFAWAPALGAGAQGYYLVVGTSKGASNLVNSGTLPTSRTSYFMPNLAPGTLWARIMTKVNGTFSRFQDISFTAAPGQGTLTNPTNGQTGVPTSGTFTWTAGTGAGVGGYYLVVGTTQGASDVVNSKGLSATTTSFPVTGMPAGRTLFARLLTKVNGAYSRFQDVTFTTG